MKKVIAKQPNSRMCLVCGLENIAGLKAEFFELESEQIVATFAACEHHQGYPGRLHGGMIAAILDETIGRAIRLRYQDGMWGVTTRLNIRYRQPVPLDATLRIVGSITHETRRRFEGSGRLLLPDDTLAAEGHGTYLKVPIEQIADFDFDKEQWQVVAREEDPAGFHIE